MDNDAKAKFILALHKHSLQAFDAGGTVLSGPNTGATTQNASSPGGLAGGIGGVLGLNNNFQAGAANIQQGTNANQLNNAYSGAQNGLGYQQNFVNQAAAQNGFGNQANVFAQQQALSNQLQQQANGQGPNPAQAALNQATGQNVANQAALMASQRGSSANSGLIARQAAQQGAGIQQQAAGQGAVLQAQQQIAAQQQLENQQAQMQNVAGNQISTQGQGANSFSGAQQNEQGILQGANQGYNNTAVAQQSNINTVNAGIAGQNQGVAGQLIGGLTAGLSPIRGLFGVTKKANGGEISGPKSFAGQWLSNKDSMLAASGGDVKAGSSNQKAVKKDNSYANDKIPTLLSEKEIVLPRSVTMRPNAPEKAAEFVRAALAKRKAGKK